MSLQAELEAQVREFKIDQIRNSTSSELFSVADSEVGGAVEGGGFKVTKSQSDKVTIYDRKGEPSEVLVYMLAKKLSQGFTLQPTAERVVGTLKCYLHPESDERAAVDAAGLRGRECRKANLLTDWDRELHMVRKHKQEWAAISRYRDRMAAEEDRAMQRTQAEAMTRLANAGGRRRGAAPDEE